MTAQKGNPPLVEADNGKSSVGGRTITFDGRKLTVD
jgi:hypothetical protein